MKYKINIKGGKKEKTTKRKMAPKGFEPRSCGARGRARFHWAN
jgi:hypothetical protein